MISTARLVPLKSIMTRYQNHLSRNFLQCGYKWINNNASGISRSSKTTQVRTFYTPPSLIPPLTQEEEEIEKYRVAALSPDQRKLELQVLDQELALLYMKRGIITGEQYTMKGKIKALARDYGIAFTAWYGVVWLASVSMIWAGVEYGGVDVMELLAMVDDRFGTALSKHVDPTIGTIGLVLIANEFAEPLRLPFVFMTTKPVVHFIFPEPVKAPLPRVNASAKPTKGMPKKSF